MIVMFCQIKRCFFIIKLLLLAGTRGNIPDSCEFCGGTGRVDCPECDGSDPNCCGGPNVDCPECQ
jgi:hypothetical protein